MTDAARKRRSHPVASVGLDDETLARVVDMAAEDGVSRSHAAGVLASAGAAAMLNETAEGNAAIREARATMPDGTTPKLTPGLVESRALPQVARELCSDARWLSALPQAQRRDMSAHIARAASSLAADDGTVAWPLVLSAARVMCKWSRPPWTLTDAARPEACRRADERIASLLSQLKPADTADDGVADASDADVADPATDVTAEAVAELASLSAWRLAAEVTDVPGMPPEGPLALVAALLAPRAGGLVDEQTVALRKEAGDRLSALLGADADEARAVGTTAKSALQALRLANDAAERDAALALAGYAQRLARPQGSEAADRQDGAALALSQRGAREIVGYAKAHPRAKLAALEAAGHVSHTTLRRRLVQLEAAGVMRNAGTPVRPLWQVAGVERDAEDELTDRQQQVLALMRRDPPAKTHEIVAEIGVSAATVFTTYHELAALGLAQKSGTRWVAVSKGDQEGIGDKR